MISTRGAGGRVGVGALRPRPWLASVTRAGLARPPIPLRGLGFRLSDVGGSLAPPAAIALGSARPGSRPESPNPHPAAGDTGGSQRILAEGGELVATVDPMANVAAVAAERRRAA